MSSDRFTVVFDDPGLYRRLKVRAAEEGQPVKRLIEEAVSHYLGSDPSQPLKPVDWDVFDAWQADARAADRESDYPENLSDIKEQLYGGRGTSYVDDLDHPGERRQRYLAEERAEYGDD